MKRSGLRAKPLDPDEVARRAKVKADVYARDRRCLMDHLPWHTCWGGPSVHHVEKSWKNRRGYTTGNLVQLCVGANRWVEDEPIKARVLGLVVGVDGIDHAEAERRRVAHGLTPDADKHRRR